MSLVWHLRTILETIQGVIAGGKVATTATIDASDIELGAVELKNAASDDRAKIAATTSVAEGDVVLGVQAPVLGVTSGAALSADGNGTLQQYARSLFKEFLARIGATDGAAVVTDATGTIQQYLRGLVKIFAPQAVTTIANALATDADATSDVLTLDGTPRHVHLAIDCAGTGTRAGPIYIQESDDGTTWYNMAIEDRLTGGVANNIPLVASVALSVGVDVETSAQRLKCFFDYTSGTTAALTIKAKVK